MYELQAILEHVASGGNLIDFCNERGQKYYNVERWLNADEERWKLYQHALSLRSEFFVQVLLKGFYEIANFDVRQAFNNDGTLKDIKDMPAILGSTIASIDTFEEYSPNGQYLGRVRKIRFNDKLKAMELLAKNLGILVEKHEVKFDVNFSVKLKQARERIKRLQERASLN